MRDRTLSHVAVAGLIVATVVLSTPRGQRAESWIGHVECERDAVRTVPVANADELDRALAAAGPGDLILLADGVYDGTFELTASGTAGLPIELCSAGGAVIDGGTRETGYALHLTGDHWIVRGLVLRNANKGVVLDGAAHNLLDRIEVFDVGQEGVHFRTHSTDNILRGSWIHDTGRVVAEFGEGVYIGSANNNWCRYTDCQPDRSDRNVVETNRIGPGVTAESIDIKEGTRWGTMRGNWFLGEGMSGADSWIDVKGNDNLIVDNRGADSVRNGFEVNVAVLGWGRGNRFVGNVAEVNAAGYGFAVDAGASGTVIDCDNVVSGAASGRSSLPCRHRSQ